jgi:hypothetical protein
VASGCGIAPLEGQTIVAHVTACFAAWANFLLGAANRLID